MYGVLLNEKAFLQVTLELHADSTYQLLWSHNLTQYFHGLESTCRNTGRYFIRNDYLFLTLNENEEGLPDSDCNIFIQNIEKAEFEPTLTKKESKSLDEIIRKNPMYSTLRIVDGDKIYFDLKFDVLEEVWEKHFIKKQRSTTKPMQH
jgi:hypothetical protein